MRFRVPVLVLQDGKAYVARPLFFTQPTRRDDNLNRLLTKLTGDIVRKLELVAKINRQDEVAHWAFSPAMTHHRLPLTVELRRRQVKGKFLFVSFQHLDRRLAFTPSVPDLWFEVSRNERLEDRAKAVLDEHWCGIERDADDPDTVDPAANALAGKAWVQVVDVMARVPAVLPQFDPRAFLMIGGSQEPDGASELWRVGRCLDWLYPEELERAVLREPEVTELHRLLAANDRRPMLLVGPRQVGKTAIVHECVYRRVSERKRVHVQRENVWLIAPQRLISGMSYVGQWEGRLLAILKHARKKDHVLYFDDIIGLFLAGMTSQSTLSAAMVLKPYLEDREVRILGEITPEGLRVLRERDRGFADQFHILPVREPTSTETLRVLAGVQRRLEAKHACNFGLDVIPTAIDMQRRYERASAFPGKAAAVLTRLAVRAGAGEREHDDATAAKLRLANPLGGRPLISRNEVFADIAAKSGLSLAFLDPQVRLDRDEVRDQLSEHVIGQPAAAEALADVVSIAKARLNDPSRPLAAFLFLGPTGVGKTESAKAVAKVLFGDADRLVRFDLNEFNQPGAAARLVGTFSRPEGLLTAAIRRQPFAVILLDEIEKADPEVFDLLLQVLGEGRLTDALGRTADFTNAIIMLTSNLGVRDAEGRLGFGAKDDSRAYVRAAEKFFRPEFFNRLDRVIPFRRLERADLAKIAQRLVDGVLGRSGFSQRNCVLNVTPDAMNRVIDAGYDPALGARAMKRAVERELTRPAAAKLTGLAPDELTIVTIRDAGESLAVDVRAPGWVTKVPIHEMHASEERIAAARDALARVEERIAELRPEEAIVGGKITIEQERYFALREIAGDIAEILDRVEGAADSRKHSYLEARQHEAIGRRSRFRALKHLPNPSRMNWSAEQPMSSLVSAMSMEEAIRELLESAEVLDVDQELFDVDNRLALLRLMASAPEDGRPTYLWIRSFPPGITNPFARVVSLPMYETAWATGVGVDVARIADGVPTSDVLVQVKGVHARALALTEVGTHLVLPKHGGPKPVRVDVVEQWPPPELPDPFAFGPIVRIYPEGQPILDVRTGLVAPTPYSPEILRTFTLTALPRG